MKKAKKPTWFYIGGLFFLIATFINFGSDDSNKWGGFLWAALSGFMFFMAYKKSKQYKEENAKETRVFIKLKNFYQSVLNGTDLNKTDEIVLEIISTENLPEPMIKGIAKKAVKLIMDETVSKETASGSLSPDGYNTILTTAKRLNVDLQIDAKTNNILSKLRHYWSIENEELSIVNTSISLQKGEVCYYQNSCRWLEHRKVTKGVSYSGVSGSFKIAKGIRYRVGYVKPKRVTVDTLSEIDKGNLFLTNKRIIFMGANKNSNIKYSSVLSIVPYSDGVGIEKDSGKSPILMCSDADIMARILARLNNE